MPVYFEWGTRPAATAGTTTSCNECVATMAALVHPQLSYDTERDARTTFDNLGQVILFALGLDIWVRLWNSFSCRNTDCQVKVPCGTGPTWVQLGTIPVQVGQNIIWRFYIEVAREIKCVGDGESRDITRPEFPQLPPPPRSEPPYPLPEEDRPVSPSQPSQTEPMEFKFPGTDVVFVGDFEIRHT